MINEQRKNPRKVLKAKALLAMEGLPPMPARTLDIAVNGIAVSTPQQLPVGATGKISFDLFFEGKMVPISARARALYCIISNGEFKVGFQFISVDLAGMTTLAKFLR